MWVLHTCDIYINEILLFLVLDIGVHVRGYLGKRSCCEK